MAMNKIERIDKEIQKTREKITEYQNKLKTLEVQRTEAENLQIVQLVRAMNMTPAELTALLSGGGIPGMTPIPADHYNEQEDKRRCSVCGAAFASTSNNVKYCPDCRKYITRRQAAERMRKKRALVTK